jgi:hypothetical protein
MTVKVKTAPGAQVANLEKIINDALAKPEAAGYGLVAAFPSPDGTNIVLIFQKP